MDGRNRQTRKRGHNKLTQNVIIKFPPPHLTTDCLAPDPILDVVLCVLLLGCPKLKECDEGSIALLPLLILAGAPVAIFLLGAEISAVEMDPLAKEDLPVLRTVTEDEPATGGRGFP